MSIASRTSTDWLNGSYVEDRNLQIKTFEDASLIGGSRQGAPVVGGNITVGYGWDIDEQSYSATISSFAAAGVTLTSNEQTALDGYKNHTVVTFDIGGTTVTREPTQADLVSVWQNFTVTDAQATALLDLVIQTWEAGLSAALGAGDIPQSRERAAIMSLLYNTTSGTATAIENFAPTMIGLIEGNPATPEEEYLQRAGIWYEIVYGTNALRPNDTLEIGIQNRREAEGGMFGLFTEDGPNGARTPSTTDQYLESRTIIQFLDGKNLNNALVAYYTNRHFDEATVKDRIDLQYELARKQLLSVYYSPDLEATPDEVTVTVDGKGLASNVAVKNFGQDVTSQKNLVLAEDLDDTVNGGGETDALYGGDGVDTVDYSSEGGTVNETFDEADIQVGPNTAAGEPTLLVTDTYGKTDTLISIEFLRAPNGADEINLEDFTGSIGIDGGGGNDTLTGGSGKDSLFGGEGLDSIAGAGWRTNSDPPGSFNNSTYCLCEVLTTSKI